MLSEQTKLPDNAKTDLKMKYAKKNKIKYLALK